MPWFPLNIRNDALFDIEIKSEHSSLLTGCLVFKYKTIANSKRAVAVSTPTAIKPYLSLPGLHLTSVTEVPSWSSILLLTKQLEERKTMETIPQRKTRVKRMQHVNKVLQIWQINDLLSPFKARHTFRGIKSWWTGLTNCVWGLSAWKCIIKQFLNPVPQLTLSISEWLFQYLQWSENRRRI